MDHLADYNAARQEAYEEAGVAGHVRRTAIGTYTYDKRQKDGTLLLCRVLVFAMEVAEKLDDWPERGERRRAWFGALEAAEKVDEEGLKSLIAALADP
jgi:8-oxo-dGTP pyrophosphatase MutT (NUDIX family)